MCIESGARRMLSEQFALSLAGTASGFVAALFFCVGAVSATASKIEVQSVPIWDFHEPVARALSAQRAQYTAGALLLVVSFALQIAASLASPSTPAELPQWLQSWPRLVLLVLGGTGLVAAALAWLMHKSTMRKVLQINKELQPVPPSQPATSEDASATSTGQLP